MKKTALAAAIAVLLPALLIAPLSAATSRERVGSTPLTIEHLSTVPFDGGIAVGARLVGDRLFVTSQKHFSIYDVSDPVQPALLSVTPFGFKCCNEDVATNGKILLFSETFPEDRLHVWDVQGALPNKLAELEIPRQHTITCVLDCKWAYGSEGGIFDLQDPSMATHAGSWDVEGNPTHDLEEFRPGYVVNSPLSAPWRLEVTDVRRPLAPRMVRSAHASAPGIDGLTWFHQSVWPRHGRDRFLIVGAEGTPGPIQVFDTSHWRSRGGLALTDRYSVGPGEVEGDSSHWFDVHPRFRDGGLLAVAWNDHGTRFLEIDDEGKIEEVGAFQLPLAQAEAAYWANDEIVFVIDYNHGIDILKVTRA